MERTFLFVDCGNVDHATRKSIRRHVMNGKNAGKTLHRSSRLDLIRRASDCDSHTLSKRISSTSNKKKTKVERTLPSPIVNNRILGNLFRSLSFPLELTPHALEVINHHFLHVADKLYPCQIGLSADDTKYTWLQVLLSDEAALYCTISALETTNEFFLCRGTSSPGALSHLGRSLALLKKRLESEEALSDSTLAIIIMFTIQEQIRSGLKESEIHFQALMKIIELRGGLRQFERNPRLLLKIYKIDIGYALQRGAMMSFSRDRMPDMQSRLESRGIEFDWYSVASSTRHSEIHPYLYEILTDVTKVASLFNHLPRNKSLDTYTFQELLVSIFSRLIRFQPLQCSDELSTIDAVYHTGLTMFMMTLLFQYNSQRLLEFDHVITRLQAVLRRDDVNEHDDRLITWLMFLGGIWYGCGPNGEWLITKIKEVSQRLGVNSWIDVQAIITKLPWINASHDKPGMAVWDLVSR